MPPIISKEMIIIAFKKQYEETGEIPKAMSFVINRATVVKRFGSWNNALTAAGIPVRMGKSQEVQCLQCGITFMKLSKEIKKSPKHYCSHSCSAIYTNHRRVVSDDQKAKIRASLKKLAAENPIDHSKPCSVCKKIFNNRLRKTCSDECYAKHRSIQGKINGPIGGRASQAAQQRRSKGEILLFELCVKYFGPNAVLSNPQMFIDNNGNYWDADIVIPEHRIALCYNGIWHYEQVRKNHSVKQVQARDAIKVKVIFDNQYIQYIIKDMGKFNVDFVYEQFHNFIFNMFIHLELLMRADL